MIKYLEIKSGKDVVEAYYDKNDDVGEAIDWLIDNNYEIHDKKLSIMPLHISVAIDLMRNNTLGVLSSYEDKSPGDIIDELKERGYRFIINRRTTDKKYQFVVFYHGEMTEKEIQETKGQKYYYLMVGELVDSLKECVNKMLSDINEDFLKNTYGGTAKVQILTKEGMIIDKMFRGDMMELKTYIQTIMRDGFVVSLDKKSKVFHSPSTIKTVEIKYSNEHEKEQ